MFGAVAESRCLCLPTVALRGPSAAEGCLPVWLELSIRSVRGSDGAARRCGPRNTHYTGAVIGGLGRVSPQAFQRPKRLKMAETTGTSSSGRNLGLWWAETLKDRDPAERTARRKTADRNGLGVVAPSPVPRHRLSRPGPGVCRGSAISGHENRRETIGGRGGFCFQFTDLPAETNLSADQPERHPTASASGACSCSSFVSSWPTRWLESTKCFSNFSRSAFICSMK